MVNDFDFVIDDINNSYRLKVFYKDIDGNLVSSSFLAKELIKLDMSKIDIDSEKIADLDNFLLGMVRFVSEENDKFFIDIPLRSMYIFDGNDTIAKSIDIKGMGAFSPIDILHVELYYMDNISDELREIFKLSKKYFKMGMQDKFNAFTRINELSKERTDKNNYHRG